jgi:hypothetical protein
MSESGSRVAGQAEQAHVAVLQHVRIGAAVRDVARRATFCLHDGMLKYEGALLIGVAFETDEISGRCGSDLPGQAAR